MDRIRAKLDWFKHVIMPHQPALRARLRRIVANAAEHDDIVAEVLARAYANPNWPAVTHGRAYLFTIARNLVIDAARREKIVSFETVAELDLLQSGHSLEAQLCARDELRRLQQILETLPVQCRRVFISRRVQEKSLAEIADEMGLSVSTVEKHLGKAIRLFMQALAEQGNARFDQEERASEGGHRAASGSTSRNAAP